MKKTISLIALVFLFGQSIFGQYAEAPNAITFRTTASNFQFPIDNSNLDFDDYSFGGELSFIRHLNKYLNIAVPLKLARVNLPLNNDLVLKNQLIGSLDVIAQAKLMNPDKLLYPYIFAGIGTMMEPDNVFHTEFPAGLGLNVKLAEHFYFNIQSQYRFNLSDDRSQLQHAAGFLVIIGEQKQKEKEKEEAPDIADADNDGIPDGEDDCPNEAGNALLKGCPDNDGDGVANKADNCPDEVGSVELNGCPDSDGDGISDKADACPKEKGTMEMNGCPDTDNDGVSNLEDECPDIAGSIELNGCPDSDGDGVHDRKDGCPDAPGPEKYNGCPDTDGDGIIDPEDNCPEQAGSAATGGCPGIAKADKEVLDFAVQAVGFETGKATLLNSSFEFLDQLTEILKKYPNHKLKIGGHTDSIGDSETNQILSQNRAKTCYDYFIKNGIAKERLSYKGYGEKEPIATNKYKAGREKNRRVEFELYLEE